MIARRIGLLVVELALAVIALGLVLVVAGLWLGTLPVRRLRRRSVVMARVAAGQELLAALAAFATALRTPGGH